MVAATAATAAVTTAVVLLSGGILRVCEGVRVCEGLVCEGVCGCGWECKGVCGSVRVGEGEG